MLQVAAESLKAAAVTVGDETLTFEAGRASVQLYVGNVSAEFADADSMRTAMEAYGAVERAFIMHNPLGNSKACLSLLCDSCVCNRGWRRLLLVVGMTVRAASFVKLSDFVCASSSCQQLRLCDHYAHAITTFCSSHVSALKCQSLVSLACTARVGVHMGTHLACCIDRIQYQ